MIQRSLYNVSFQFFSIYVNENNEKDGIRVLIKTYVARPYDIAILFQDIKEEKTANDTY